MSQDMCLSWTEGGWDGKEGGIGSRHWGRTEVSKCLKKEDQKRQKNTRGHFMNIPHPFRLKPNLGGPMIKVQKTLTDLALSLAASTIFQHFLQC